jgi:hypothetical protein
VKYSGWWRCRIKGRTRKYPWIYFCVSAKTKREYRRQARYAAVLHLRRVDFDFEVCHKPQDLQKVGETDGVEFFYETTFAVREVRS